MARRRVIEGWEIGQFFGATVVRGWIDGRRVTALFRWWSDGRFGVSWEQLGTDEVFEVGRPATTAFDDLHTP